MLYGLTRSTIEDLRGDFRGAEVFGLISISQALGLTGAAVASVMFVRLSRKALRPGAGNPANDRADT